MVTAFIGTREHADSYGLIIWKPTLNALMLLFCTSLETLSIIAYKQPVTRGEMEKIRGVDASYVLRTLLEKKLIRISGRKKVPGRPILYGTTREFLRYFGLRDLSEIPSLEEIKPPVSG